MDQGERIRADHRELALVRDRLRAMIAAPAATLQEHRWRALWLREMDLLQRLMARHFRDEEDGGYMAEVVAKKPGLADKVDRLHGQHAVMLAHVTELCGEALDRVDHDTFGDHVIRLLIALAAHEEHETELWQSTLWTDVGGGD